MFIILIPKHIQSFLKIKLSLYDTQEQIPTHLIIPKEKVIKFLRKYTIIILVILNFNKVI
jgi:hypothetical protein